MSVKNENASVADALRSLIAEAKAVNLPLAELCRRADVPVQNVHRWKRGAHEPRFSVLAGALQRLEAALAAEKERIRAAASGQGVAA